MRYIWANTILLTLLVGQILTGFWGLISGSERLWWILWLHGVGGYAILIILVWKGAVIFKGLHRRRITPTTVGFIGLTLVLASILGTGIAWTHLGFLTWGRFTLMTIHANLTIVLAVLLIWHLFARRFVFRIRAARDRRAFFRLTGTALAGLTAWFLVERLKGAARLPGVNRRFTGSYETGSLSGRFPQVSWLFDFPRPIETETWQLTIAGAVRHAQAFTYPQILDLPAQTLTATLDCTGGWYSTQVWQGVNLGHLLDRAGLWEDARSITVEAVSGYRRQFPIAEARGFLLAYQVADQSLSHGHGAPLRLVAPGRRGFEWIKWVTRIQVNQTSHLRQSPLPLQ